MRHSCTCVITFYLQLTCPHPPPSTLSTPPSIPPPLAPPTPCVYVCVCVRVHIMLAWFEFPTGKKWISLAGFKICIDHCLLLSRCGVSMRVFFFCCILWRLEKQGGNKLFFAQSPQTPRCIKGTSIRYCEVYHLILLFASAHL